MEEISNSTFDTLERLAKDHPELEGAYARSTRGVHVDTVVAVLANALKSPPPPVVVMAAPDHPPLEACPFCSSDVTMGDLFDEDDRRMWVREIECEICQLKMREWAGWPRSNVTFNRDQLSEDVGRALASMWNRRTPLLPPAPWEDRE